MVVVTLAPATVPPGRRIYAIGDVHGCVDQLGSLHAAIAADLAARPIGRATVLHLGDYVDRGPDSTGALARLMAQPVPGAVERVNLMGNHERMLLDAIDRPDPERVALWLANGGDATLDSWGIPYGAPPATWAARLPDPQLAFMRTLDLRYAAGGYLFVHAGIRPGVPLAGQSGEDLLWIREPFLSSTAEHGAVVVHGHTPRPEPEVRANRIGIDTGAVYGGRLTCLVLEADRLGFIDR